MSDDKVKFEGGDHNLVPALGVQHTVMDEIHDYVVDDIERTKRLKRELEEQAMYQPTTGISLTGRQSGKAHAQAVEELDRKMLGVTSPSAMFRIFEDHFMREGRGPDKAELLILRRHVLSAYMSHTPNAQQVRATLAREVRLLLSDIINRHEHAINGDGDEVIFTDNLQLVIEELLRIESGTS